MVKSVTMWVRRSAVVMIILLYSIVCSVPALGSPTFVASRNSDVYHVSSCSYVDRIKESNIIYFSSAEEAEASGRRGCSQCQPTQYLKKRASELNLSGEDLIGIAKLNPGKTIDQIYVSGGGYYGGYTDGYNDRDARAKKERESSYRSGYKAGEAKAEAARDEGYMDGYDDGYNIGLEQFRQVDFDAGAESTKKKYNETVVPISCIGGSAVGAGIAVFVIKHKSKGGAA